MDDCRPRQKLPRWDIREFGANEESWVDIIVMKELYRPDLSTMCDMSERVLSECSAVGHRLGVLLVQHQYLLLPIQLPTNLLPNRRPWSGSRSRSFHSDSPFWTSTCSFRVCCPGTCALLQDHSMPFPPSRDDSEQSRRCRKLFVKPTSAPPTFF